MPPLTVGIATSPQTFSWRALDETWAAASELPVVHALWMNDHLVSPRNDRGGASLESFTTMAALAHRVPGKWLGHAVLSNTFRHPVMVAKQATAMDHITGGRFIVGLGAGWHEGEHQPFGLELPPIARRIDRYESAVAILRALFSPEAAQLPGVSLDDPFYPLRGATNEPPPVSPTGPPIWLGGRKQRGIALAVRAANGWFFVPQDRPDFDYLAGRHDAVVRDLEASGRDAGAFEFAATVPVGTTPDERTRARERGFALAAAGATHIVLSIPAAAGPEGLRTIGREVAEPLLERRPA